MLCSALESGEVWRCDCELQKGQLSFRFMGLGVEGGDGVELALLSNGLSSRAEITVAIIPIPVCVGGTDECYDIVSMQIDDFGMTVAHTASRLNCNLS